MISNSFPLSVGVTTPGPQIPPSFAQIGIGPWGKNILRCLDELSLLHTVCDINESIIRPLEENFAGAIFTTSFVKVLENPDVRAVIVATPALTHFELVKKAILAGKDVFVEKPLSLCLEEGQEIVHLADRQRKVLMVGHILQYHPAILKLKHLIVGGELGRIQYIYANRLNIGQ